MRRKSADPGPTDHQDQGRPRQQEIPRRKGNTENGSEADWDSSSEVPSAPSWVLRWVPCSMGWTAAICIQRHAPGDFAMSLLVLSAAVMKADQKIMKSELDYVRNFFIQQFGMDEGTRLVSMLREILKQDINVPEVSAQVGQYMDYSVKLQLLHYLFGIASADGLYHADEVGVIENIAHYMNISSSDFQSVKAMFVKNPGWAYDVLEIPSSATNDEVKKAYRDLAKIHHPDKVGHLGEDIRRAATENSRRSMLPMRSEEAERNGLTRDEGRGTRDEGRGRRTKDEGRRRRVYE